MRTASREQVALATWDFSVQGGTIGSIVIPNVIIPAGAIITKVVSDSIVAPVGASGTLALAVIDEVSSVITLVAAVAITNYSIGTRVTETLNGSATAIKVLTNSKVEIVIATTNQTAGKINYWIYYCV